MSSWLFLAYPALIFTQGLFSAWAAIGLTVFMFLNWQFIAPRIRTATEQVQSLTLNSYFETRFSDTSGRIRLISAAMSVFFFTFYISSGLWRLGVLVESLFDLNYLVGISIGLLIVMALCLHGRISHRRLDRFIPGIFPPRRHRIYSRLFARSILEDLAPVMDAVADERSFPHLSSPIFHLKTLWQIL